MKNTRNKESLPAKVGSGLKPVSPIDSLAHEIRDPLTTIMASAELLERGVGSGARRRWLLDAILESSERIAAALDEAQENKTTHRIGEEATQDGTFPGHAPAETTTRTSSSQG